MHKTRVLAVDDELGIIKFLRANLESKGYEVLAAMDGTEALQLIEREVPDLILLDIKMPMMDGFEVCRRLREWSQIPIIMLSTLSDEKDKVKCLDMGADDYITKPFGASEVVARVRAVLRRAATSPAIPTRSTFTYGNLQINFASRQITVDGREVQLTPTEYSLLQELVLNAGKVLTHTHLLNKIWGAEYQDETEYLHVFVRRLRSKLGTTPASQYIITIPGVGYQVKAAM